MVSPPPDASQVGSPALPPNRTGGAGGSPDPQPGAAAAPAAGDRNLIRPLDLKGALQILLAEVRAALDLALLDTVSAFPAASDTVLKAVGEVVESFLKALPEGSTDVTLWSEVLPRADVALQSGLARALGVIDAWRGVPPAVAASAREVSVLVTHALGDEPLNPLWVRPEWLGLAPRLERLRRRRRVLKRRLTDPDYRPTIFDESEPPQ
jgi:hypothetical protein